MTTEHNNPFLIAQQQFDSAAAILNLPQDIRDLLRVPQRELAVTCLLYTSPSPRD